MRTGLIHLTGLAATLLLLLTLIAWVDNRKRSVVSGYVSTEFWTMVGSTDGCFYLHVAHGARIPLDGPPGWYFRHDAIPSIYQLNGSVTRWLPGLYCDLAQRHVSTERLWTDTKLLWTDHDFAVGYGWVAGVCAVGSSLYLRFLLRRHRGYAGGHGRPDIAADAVNRHADGA